MNLELHYGCNKRQLYVFAVNHDHSDLPLASNYLQTADRAAVRWRDLAACGVTSATISRLVQTGQVERIGRGLYRLPNQDASVDQSLAQVAQSALKGTICSLSALQWHGLTTQLPQAVWLMIAHKDRPPTTPPARLAVVRASSDALTVG